MICGWILDFGAGQLVAFKNKIKNFIIFLIRKTNAILYVK